MRIPTGENHWLRDTRGTTGLVSVDKKNRSVQFSDLLDVNAVESSTKHGKFYYKNIINSFWFNHIHILHVDNSILRFIKKNDFWKDVYTIVNNIKLFSVVWIFCLWYSKNKKSWVKSFKLAKYISVLFSRWSVEDSRNKIVKQIGKIKFYNFFLLMIHFLLNSFTCEINYNDETLSCFFSI